MGVVYRAYDTVLKREVTLKTIRDIQDKATIEMFRKECNVLAGMAHPNIVEIYDIGETSEHGGKRPYFVMPLLRGDTLDKLIASPSSRLTVERCVDMMTQVCRGLQAAHDKGLVHRDLKPSNLFVLEDDSVKIIDFGVAHLLDNQSTVGLKGTLLYMAPEQLQMKKPTPLSDLFALAVVCFVTLTRRHPFEGKTRDDIAQAILTQTPPPASQFNPLVSPALSQVIHKAMAKQPYHRFANVREFSENLIKALHNEPIECFNPDRIEPRVHRAQKAFQEGELDFASEILTELEAEGYLHPEIIPLREKIDSTRRQKTIDQLLDTARRRLEEKEYQLALQKVQEILNLDPSNTDAHALKGQIENERSALQIEDWIRLALQHLDNHAYSHARQALQNVLQLKPKETKAQQLLAEVDRREQDYLRLRQEKEQAYQAALDALQKGDLSSALTKLESVLDMDRRAPDTFSPERAAIYQKLYNEVRSEHDEVDNSYAEARKHLDNGNYSGTLEICGRYLAKYPEHAMFQSLKLDAEDRQRQDVSAFIARIDREVDAEPDLERKIGTLEDALKQLPGENHFERALASIRSKRDLVESIVSKARGFEDRGQYGEALGQWEIVRNIYRQYPGLEIEMERVKRRRVQKDRSDARARWVEQIDQALNVNDYQRTMSLCRSALAEFPGDQELLSLQQTAIQGVERSLEAQKFLDEGQTLLKGDRKEEAQEKLRQAHTLDPANTAIRNALLEVILADARQDLEGDWKRAEKNVLQALDLDPGNALAKSLRTLIQDRKQEEYVTDALSRARNLHAQGNPESALEILDQAAVLYPKDTRLTQARSSFRKNIQTSQQIESRKRDLDEIRGLERESEVMIHAETLKSIFERTQHIATRYAGDRDFEDVMTQVQRRMEERTKLVNTDFSVGEKAPPIPPPAAPPPERPRPVPLVSKPPKKNFGTSIKETLVDWYSAWEDAFDGKWNLRRLALPTISFAAVIILLVSLATLLRPDRRTSDDSPILPTPGAFGRLVVQVTPADASYSIEDSSGKSVTDQWDKLSPGEYVLKASKPGYKPAETRVSVLASESKPVALTLVPISPAFQLAGDLQEVQATLDGQALADVNGQFSIEKLSDTDHTLNVSSKNGPKADVTFRSASNTLPQMTNVAADRFRVFVVASYNGALKVTSSVAPQEKVSLSIDGSPVGELPPEGITREGLTQGKHTVGISYAATQQQELPIELSDSPLLRVFLVRADPDMGTLYVEAGHTDAQFYIDNRQRTPRVYGSGMAVGLSPGNYQLRVEKDGYYPEQASITVRKGETTRLKLPLRETPKTGALTVANGTRGDEVSIDGGTWRPITDGSLKLDAAAGSRRVAVRRRGFKQVEKVIAFEAGREKTLDIRSEFTFVPETYKISIRLTPPEATIRIRGQQTNLVPTGSTIELTQGKYQAEVEAKDYESKTEAFEVPGTNSLEVALTRKQDTPSATKPAEEGVMIGWNPSGQWKLSDDGWLRRQSKGLSQYRNGAGTLSVTVPCKGGIVGFGGCDATLLANYQNPANHLEFEVKKNKVTRRVRVNGKPESVKDTGHSIKFSGEMRLRLVVTSSKATLSLFDGSSWREIDSYSSPEGGLTKGSFALRENQVKDVRVSSN